MIRAKAQGLSHAAGYLSAVAFAIAIVLYIRAGSFTRFMADDFCGAADRAQMGILGSVKDYYLTWDGRLASDLLNLVVQGFGAWFAAVLPCIVIIGWCVLLIFTLRLLTDNWQVSIGGALLVVYATLESAPSLAQSFFWETGTIVYGVPLILLTLYVACLILARRGRAQWGVFGAAIVLAAGGFSETYVAMQTTGLIVAFVFWRWMEKDERSKVLIPGIVASVVALAIVAMAPGNAERQKTFILYKPDFWGHLSASLLWAFYQGYRFVWQHPLTFALCLLLPAVYGTTHREQDETRASRVGLARLLAWNAGGFLVVLASVVPGYFGSGTHPPDRAMAITQFVLVCWTCAWGLLIGRALAEKNPAWVTPALVLATILLVIAGPIAGLRSVWRLGEEHRIYAEMWDVQDKALHEAGQALLRGGKSVHAHPIPLEIVLPPLPHWGGPGMESAGAEPKGGFNACIARYYGVDSVSYREAP